MAKVATAFADNRGNLHPTPEAAVLADITTILGRIGAESGITAGLAQVILEKRGEIEMAFAGLDVMMGDRPPLPFVKMGGAHADAHA